MQTLVTIPFSVRIENAVVAYAAYLEKTFVPHDLVVYYPHPGGAFSWLAIGTSAAVLLAVSGAAIAGVRRWPYLFVGWSWFLGTLVPMIGLVQVGSQQMADRYTYFPLIGLFIALVWLIADFVPAGASRTVAAGRDAGRPGGACRDGVRSSRLLARRPGPVSSRSGWSQR